jgi:alpha-glucosidase
MPKALTPHHDGSRTYVSTLEPSLGETVTVFARVPHGGSAVSAAHVRFVENGEPRFSEAIIDRVTDTDIWWRADVPATNPVTRYRWLLEPYTWLNQAGIQDYDPSDAGDFRLVTYDAPPAWVADTNFYQVFPDRFARGLRAEERELPPWAVDCNWDTPVERNWPEAMFQTYRGDLDGIARHVDHLQSLSIGGVWTTPFFPSFSNHRYDAATFDHVDPFLGGDDALVRTLGILHAAGIRMIGDLTTNHSGSTHEWFTRAQADASSIEAGFYYFRDHPEAYESFFDVPSLPKLNHRNTELQQRFYGDSDSIAARYLKVPFELDGWRIDVAQMTGRLGAEDETHRVARQLRGAMHQANPQAFLVAEHAHDASHDLDADGWHGTMNYAGFTNPVAGWLAGAEGIGNLGMPIKVPRRSGQYTARTLSHHASLISWRARTHSFNQLTSHDTPRILSRVGESAERHEVALGMMASFPGIPIVFQGDEFGMRADHEHITRSPIPWGRQGQWNHKTLAAHRRLLALRGSVPALRRGGFRWLAVDDDVLCWAREDDTDRVICLAVRHGHHVTRLPLAPLGQHWTSLYGSADLRVKAEHVELDAEGPSFTMWRNNR